MVTFKNIRWDEEGFVAEAHDHLQPSVVFSVRFNFKLDKPEISVSGAHNVDTSVVRKACYNVSCDIQDGTIKKQGATKSVVWG